LNRLFPALNEKLLPALDPPRTGAGDREALPHSCKKMPHPASTTPACLFEQSLLFCLVEQALLVLKHLFFVQLHVW
jgi:hypothetical protein